MPAPVERTASAVIAFTVPAVPTGMNVGVSTRPVRGVQHACPRGAVLRQGFPTENSCARQQRGVAIRIEPVAGLDGVFIRGAHARGAGKRADQHEQASSAADGSWSAAGRRYGPRGQA